MPEVDIYVEECALKVKDVERARKILQSFKAGSHFSLINDSEIDMEERHFVSEYDEYLLLAALAHVAEGHIVFMDTDCEYWKIELKDGKITEYVGIVTLEKPEPARPPKEYVSLLETVFVEKCDAVVNDPDRAWEILENHNTCLTVHGSFLDEGDGSYETSHDEHELFTALAKVAEGNVVFRNMHGDFWRYEMRDGKAYYYPRYKIPYEKGKTASLPPEFVERKMIVNNRYAMAMMRWGTLIAFDMKEGKFYKRPYENTIKYITFIENVAKEKDVAELATGKTPDASILVIFTKTISEEYPHLEPVIRRAMLADLV